MNPYLYNTPFDDGSLLAWGAQHQQEHFLLAWQIWQKFSGTSVAVQPIDPVPVRLDMLTWTMNHQMMHNEVNSVLGTSGYDLSGVNFANREMLLVWMNEHANEHFKLSLVLAGIQPGQPQQLPSGLAGSSARTP